MTKRIIFIFAALCSLQARASVRPAQADTVRYTSFTDAAELLQPVQPTHLDGVILPMRGSGNWFVGIAGGSTAFLGTLLGCEDKAEKLFADKVDGIVDILQKPAAGKTVSFFYITSNGAANVRKSTDYIAEMISLAGGKYIFDDLTDDTAKSTVNMQMESFYAGAKDADVMIYNATIDSELQTLDQLLEKSPLLADFKAVKTGNVWCTEKNLYQSTMELDELIRDFHTVIADGDSSTLKYLHKLS